MKNLKITALILLFSATMFAQDCSTFYPFTEGSTSTLTSYNRKGKVMAEQEMTIITVGNKNGYETATAQTILKDEKGKQITETNFDITCKANGVEVDIKSMMSPDLFKQYEGMDMDISGTNVILPNTLTIGDSLPDATMNMAMDMSGIKMNIDVAMTDRKVVAREDLTTPAGTFDCYVIEYTSNVKMGINKKSKAKQWIAKGVGLVKFEDYNKKGKLTTRNLLTAFSK